MLKRNRIDKNKGFLFFIEGFAGSGKSSIGIKSYKKINVLFGPTIIVHGNQLRDILNVYGYSKIEKKKITYKINTDVRKVNFIRSEMISLFGTDRKRAFARYLARGTGRTKNDLFEKSFERVEQK